MKNVKMTHEDYVRTVLADPRRSAKLLSKVLPQSFLSYLKLDTIRPIRDALIPSGADELWAELVFEVDAGKNNTVFPCIFLIKYRSYKDPHVYMQLRRNIFALYHKMLQVDEWIAPVIPIILYSGAEPWEIPSQFIDTLDIDEWSKEAAADYIVNFSAVIINLNPPEGSSQRVDIDQFDVELQLIFRALILVQRIDSIRGNAHIPSI